LVVVTGALPASADASPLFFDFNAIMTELTDLDGIAAASNVRIGSLATGHVVWDTDAPLNRFGSFSTEGGGSESGLDFHVGFLALEAPFLDQVFYQKTEAGASLGFHREGLVRNIAEGPLRNLAEGPRELFVTLRTSNPNASDFPLGLRVFDPSIWESGEVVLYGDFNGTPSWSGKARITSVPEPPAWLILLSAALLLRPGIRRKEMRVVP
jgi:hypothetical protein